MSNMRSFFSIKRFIKQSNEGQAILFVIVGLTVALAVGVGVSVRSLSSTSRVARTDTASRVLAAAEGGAERFLALPKSALDSARDWAATGSGECPNGTSAVADGAEHYCLVSYETAGDNIIAEAHVTVTDFWSNITVPNVGNGYYFKLSKGGVKEVVLNDAGNNPQVDICWKGVASPTGVSDLYLIEYNSAGTVRKLGLKANTAVSASPYTTGGGADAWVTASVPSNNCPTDYRNVYRYNPANSSYGLRFKAIYDDADVVLIPVGNQTLQVQGYAITSLGILRNQADNAAIVASKIVTVFRSYPYISSVFDFGLVAKDGIVN